DRLVGIHLDGIPDVSRPVRPGDGVSWQAMEQGRTVVLDDYQRAERRLSERGSIRSVVITPIRVDGRPIGTVMCARHQVGPPSDAEVEIAEVLADHLGGVIAAAQRRERQQQLLRRVEELDRMRSGLVDAVSAELRDPLTIVRGIASILRVHGDRLPPGERRAFLERLGAQTQDLRRVVDAILDFSRFQAKRGAADLQVLPLAEVLAPTVGEDEVELVPPLAELPDEPFVRVDPQLIHFGLQLLTEARLGADGHVHRVRLEVLVGDEAVTLVRRMEGSPPISTLTVSLATQLLVAAGAAVDADDEPRIHLSVADVEVVR
ncbi:MAG: GAF domain-containing protein, partial [Nitriliruptoraceae bacterium]